ncbi:MAG: acyltransferase [Alphaproteobacteria bacterium]|nr:acyltransferase [Alphaproteobacteria bacterium]
MATSKKRDIAQDIAKAIGILAVVYAHVLWGLVSSSIFADGNPLHFIDMGLQIYTMPLFFLLAGYNAPSSLKRSTPAEFIRKRASMLIPVYLIWSVVQGGMKYALSGQVNDPVTLQDLLAIPYKPIGQFWFLYALLIYHIATALLYRRPWVLASLAIAAFLANPWLEDFPRDYCYSGIFYVLGFLLANKDLPSIKAKHIAPALGVAVIVYACGLAMNWSYGLDSRNLLLLPATLSGIGLVMFLSQKLSASSAGPALAYVGRASLAIYVLHVICFAGWRAFILKLGVTEAYVHLVTGTLVGLGVPLLLYSVLGRFKLRRYAYLG